MLLEQLLMSGGIKDIAKSESFAAPVSTGLFNITGDFSWTPAFALFCIGDVVNTAGQENQAVMGYGMTDGANHWWMSHRSRHNHGAANSYFWSANDNPIGMLENTTLLFEAAFSKFIPGGVELNALTVGGAFLGFALFLPPTWDVKVGNTTPHNTAGNSVPVSGVGFQPDSLLMASCPQGENFSDTRFSSSDGGHSFGGWTSPNYRQLTWSENSGASPTRLAAVLRTDGICQAVNGENLDNDPEYQISNVGADGFDIVTTNANASGTTGIGYVALRHPTAAMFAGAIQTNVSDYTASGLDLTNGAVLSLMSVLPGYNTTYTDTQADCFSMGVADTDNERSLAFCVRDGTSTTETSTECRNAFITATDKRKNIIVYGQKANPWVINNGYSINWTQIDGIVRLGIYFAFGE